MGELVVGRPALKLQYLVSAPLDLVSGMALLYRAVPGSGLDPWLITARRSLDRQTQLDLDLLHGFSGRMLVYMEEPIWAFGPLSLEHQHATIEELLQFLHGLPPEAYLDMVDRALVRVHNELRSGVTAPERGDIEGWRRYLEPALTTALIDDVLALLANPTDLKARTIALIDRIWEQVLGPDYDAHLPVLQSAVNRAARAGHNGFAPTFVDLTDNRLPSALVAGVHDVESVTFAPSSRLGSYISYTNYAPDLVVYFSAPLYLERVGATAEDQDVGVLSVNGNPPQPQLTHDDLLDSMRALSDPNRLRIIELLAAGELYAQEIVGRLSIAQSAVSRHLALLERAGVIRVRPHGGMKYYAVSCERMEALALALRRCGGLR